MYEITKDQYKIAEKIGVLIFPSDNVKKKIDVYTKDGLFFASIGSSAHKDYFIYYRDDGKDYATTRRRLYDLRTKKNYVGGRAWLARKLLWSL
jgi:hypothetical protein